MWADILTKPLQEKEFRKNEGSVDELGHEI